MGDRLAICLGDLLVENLEAGVGLCAAGHLNAAKRTPYILQSGIKETAARAPVPVGVSIGGALIRRSVARTDPGGRWGVGMQLQYPLVQPWKEHQASLEDPLELA